MEFKYFGCVRVESGTYGAGTEAGEWDEGSRSHLVPSYAKDLQLVCARVLHETLFVPFLTYDSETMLWKEKEISKIMVAQMENLRGFLGVRRMDRVPNARIRESCGVTKE